jgi:hypothetical protein
MRKHFPDLISDLNALCIGHSENLVDGTRFGKGSDQNRESDKRNDKYKSSESHVNKFFPARPPSHGDPMHQSMFFDL